MIASYILLCKNRPLFSTLAYWFSFACTYKVFCFIFTELDEVHVGHVTFTNGVLRGSPVEEAMHIKACDGRSGLHLIVNESKARKSYYHSRFRKSGTLIGIGRHSCSTVVHKSVDVMLDP
jgi:hypothetical protein